MIHLFVVTLFLQLSTPSFKATSTLSKDTNLVGDNITYTIKVRHAKSISVVYPGSKDSVWGDIDVRNYVHKENEEAGEMMEEASYTIALYDTGYHKTPKLPIKYIENSKEKEFLLDKKTIYIKSVLDTSKKVIDIKTIKEIPFPMWMIYTALGVLLLLLVIGYFMYRYFKNKPKKLLEKKEVVVKRDPYLVAVEKLQELEKMKMESQSEFKIFYSVLSDILREFLEEYYHILALEQITSEIIEALQSRLHMDRLTALQKILERADMVKFAKFYPTTFETREDIQNSIFVIEVGKPKLVPPLQNPNDSMAKN